MILSFIYNRGKYTFSGLNNGVFITLRAFFLTVFVLRVLL